MRALMLGLPIAALLGACSGGGSGACVPGRTAPCVCAGGERGVQTCGDGRTFGACDCTGAMIDAGTSPWWLGRAEPGTRPLWSGRCGDTVCRPGQLCLHRCGAESTPDGACRDEIFSDDVCLDLPGGVPSADACAVVDWASMCPPGGMSGWAYSECTNYWPGLDGGRLGDRPADDWEPSAWCNCSCRFQL